MGRFTERAIDEYVRQLASKEPVPGGGGTAALVGALAAALGEMVANLTLGKPKYSAVDDEIQMLKAAISTIREELLVLVEKDAEVFAPLAAAYRMAFDTEEDKAEKERVMQACLKRASLVPLEIMERCAEMLPLVEKLAKKGSALAVSDAGCAAVLSKAAIEAAWLNVCINVRVIKDEDFAGDTNARGKEILEKSVLLADQIYSAVEAKLTHK